jgi:hypothetical protein
MARDSSLTDSFGWFKDAVWAARVNSVKRDRKMIITNDFVRIWKETYMTYPRSYQEILMRLWNHPSEVSKVALTKYRPSALHYTNLNGVILLLTYTQHVTQGPWSIFSYKFKMWQYGVASNDFEAALWTCKYCMGSNAGSGHSTSLPAESMEKHVKYNFPFVAIIRKISLLSIADQRFWLNMRWVCHCDVSNVRLTSTLHQIMKKMI